MMTHMMDDPIVAMMVLMGLVVLVVVGLVAVRIVGTRERRPVAERTAVTTAPELPSAEQ